MLDKCALILQNPDLSFRLEDKNDWDGLWSKKSGLENVSQSPSPSLQPPLWLSTTPAFFLLKDYFFMVLNLRNQNFHSSIICHDFWSINNFCTINNFWSVRSFQAFAIINNIVTKILKHKSLSPFLILFWGQT